jgi:hypothetical protein
MSQLLTPTGNGIIPEIQTTLLTSRINLLSTQYIESKNLESRPTEWVPGGRPIYRRLPAISETYQIDFYNIVPESNVGPGYIEEVGYVFVPWGESDLSSSSVRVSASESKGDLIISSGSLVWRQGKTFVYPALVNLEVLEVLNGRYDLAYQLIFNDEPLPFQYSVIDFALTGLPLTIIASTDSTIGWRFPAVNAFLDTTTLNWSTEDSYYPSYAQPASSYIQWESILTQSYESITLRCPTGTAYTGTATLYYVNNGVLSEVTSTEISSDTTGQYFTLLVTSQVLQTGWKVEFSSAKISIQSITVTGVITLLERPSVPVPRASLVLYPSGTLPVGETFCLLAEITVNNDYQVTKLRDTRNIIRRDYTPVSDWLTKPFDTDLTNLYEEVSIYPTTWMNPPTAMKQEYYGLTQYQVIVEN